MSELSSAPAAGDPVPERFARWMVPAAVAEVAVLAALTRDSSPLAPAGVAYVAIGLTSLALSIILVVAAAMRAVRGHVVSLRPRDDRLFLVGAVLFGVGTAAAFLFALTWTIWS
jgi:hypothetical protein